LFTVYISPVSSVTSPFGVLQQQYADDTKIYIAVSQADPSSSTQNLESALSALSSWFTYNMLSLNPAKSDAI